MQTETEAINVWGLAIGAAFLLSWLLLPPVRSLAWRIGTVDVPHDKRRMHSVSTPRNGGLAIYTAFLISALLFCRQEALLRAALKGGLLMLALGLADDRLALPAGLKLALELSAAALVVERGMALRGIPAAIGVFWIVMLTNVHNMIDGLNGLLSGIAVIECISLSCLSAMIGVGAVLPPLLLAAACAGFLPFNYPHASAFAGDCGSGSIGFLLGVFSFPLLQSADSMRTLVAPLFIFAYPLTDLFAAVLRRLQRGRPIFTPDRAHLHHRICASGISPWVGTLLLWVLSAALCTVGVLCGGAEQELLTVAAIAFALAVLIFIRRFLLHFAQNS